jgi:hypothetical protein
LIEPLFLNIGADPVDINDIQETVFDILVDCVGSHFRSPSESELLAIFAPLRDKLTSSKRSIPHAGRPR